MITETATESPADSATPEKGLGVPRLVRLVKCGRQSCGHIMTEGERADEPHPKFANCMKQVCPKCGCNSFWALNKHGQTINGFGDDVELNPEDIEPTKRQGLKTKRRLLACKRRCLANV